MPPGCRASDSRRRLGGEDAGGSPALHGSAIESRFMPGNTTLQVAEFVRALAVAWKNLTAYPPGHPALAVSLQGAHRRLMELRGPAGEVVFGIASDGLIYGSEKIESPHVQKFAQAL